MNDIIEREGDRIYINRTPPCGHGNGTHPSGCWWPTTSEMIGEAVVAERARIRDAVKGMPLPVGPDFQCIELHPEIIAAVLAIIDGGTP